MIDPSVNGRLAILRALDDLDRREWEQRMDDYTRMRIPIFDEVSADLITRNLWVEGQEKA
jgi:hypothetical protein